MSLHIFYLYLQLLKTACLQLSANFPPILLKVLVLKPLTTVSSADSLPLTVFFSYFTYSYLSSFPPPTLQINRISSFPSGNSHYVFIVSELHLAALVNNGHHHFHFPLSHTLHQCSLFFQVCALLFLPGSFLSYLWLKATVPVKIYELVPLLLFLLCLLPVPLINPFATLSLM